MSPEEVQAPLAENAALRAEVSALRLQVAELTQQLQATLVRIAELEQAQAAPPRGRSNKIRLPLLALLVGGWRA